MLEAGCIYYEVFNEQMPQRRLFVALRDADAARHFQRIYRKGDELPHEAMHRCRLANIHVWVRDTPEFERHLVFRDYLREHPEERDAYGRLKQQLSQQEWSDMMAYNRGKEDLILEIQAKALKGR